MTLVEKFREAYPREPEYKKYPVDYGCIIKHEVEDFLAEQDSQIEREKRDEVLDVLDRLLSGAEDVRVSFQVQEGYGDCISGVHTEDGTIKAVDVLKLKMARARYEEKGK